MEWEALAAIGEIVGAFAVVVTLLYLAVQTRLARGEARAAAIRANRNERREFFTGLRDAPQIPEIIMKAQNGVRLSEEEHYRLQNHSAAHWGLIYSEWIQRKLRLTDEYTPNPGPGVVLAFDTPGGEEWWEAAGARLYPVEFVDWVESIRRDRAPEDERAVAVFGQGRPEPR